MALLLRLRGGKGEGWACGRKARAIFLDVGESSEFPHRTLLCSTTEETQEIISKWKHACVHVWRAQRDSEAINQINR